MSEEKGKPGRPSFNCRLNGLFQEDGRNSPWTLVSGETYSRSQRASRKDNCLPFGAFLIICCFSICQQKGRFWKKSGPVVKLITNHSHFSSGKSGFQFIVLRTGMTWNMGLQSIGRNWLLIHPNFAEHTILDFPITSMVSV